VLLLAPVYLNLMAWFPKGLRQQRYWLFGLGNSLTVAVVTLLPLLLAGAFTVSAQPAILNLTNALSLVLLSTGYQYAIDYFKERRKKQQLAQKQMETELQMLRMQLNPHFLFNTLNNLYGLAITKSDHLPDLMLKLS
jgi:sensor histidine kinase YesM